jgi:hypothetical protein
MFLSLAETQGPKQKRSQRLCGSCNAHVSILVSERAVLTRRDRSYPLVLGSARDVCILHLEDFRENSTILGKASHQIQLYLQGRDSHTISSLRIMTILFRKPRQCW